MKDGIKINNFKPYDLQNKNKKWKSMRVKKNHANDVAPGRQAGMMWLIKYLPLPNLSS